MLPQISHQSLQVADPFHPISPFGEASKLLLERIQGMDYTYIFVSF
jgi:hypothetical protein